MSIFDAFWDCDYTGRPVIDHVNTASVPVLLLGFNRPDKLPRVIEPLRSIKPQRVFIAIDGPREGRPDEAEKCLATQRAAEAAIDWECQVERLYRDRNLGCRRAVSEAITWALQRVEEVLIIEDDCIVDPSFVTLSRMLLDRYRHDERVACISASNLQRGKWRGDGGYYASKYPHCWGWATWRRAWKQYTDDLAPFESFSQTAAYKALHLTEMEREYWRHVIDLCRLGKVDSWSYRWTFSCWLKGMVALLPNKNLVTNVGFGEDSTHTKEQCEITNLRHEVLEDFSAPSSLAVDRAADEATFRRLFCAPASPMENFIVSRRFKKLRSQTQQMKEELRDLKKLSDRWQTWQDWARLHPVRAAWRVLRGKL